MNTQQPANTEFPASASAGELQPPDAQVPNSQPPVGQLRKSGERQGRFGRKPLVGAVAVFLVGAAGFMLVVGRTATDAANDYHAGTVPIPTENSSSDEPEVGDLENDQEWGDGYIGSPDPKVPGNCIGQVDEWPEGGNGVPDNAASVPCPTADGVPSELCRNYPQKAVQDRSGDWDMDGARNQDDPEPCKFDPTLRP